MTALPRTLLVGCGEMGTALLRGWLASFPPKQFTVITRHPESFDYNFPGVAIGKSLDDFSQESNWDEVVFAIKPQDFSQLSSGFTQLFKKKPLCISVAAGLTTPTLTNLFSTDQIVRAMPNLTAAVGSGVTLLYKTVECTEKQKKSATALFESVGETHWLTQESQFNLATAFTGCGPGFLYRFIEGLIEVVCANGFPRKDANILAKQLLLGSARFAKSSPLDFKDLTRKVAVAGGMTAAGISALDADNCLNRILEDMILSAVNQGEKLDR